MDNRRAQFLIAVGDLCTAAGLAELEVDLSWRGDGGGVRAIRGIPRPTRSCDELEEIGYARTLRVDDRVIEMQDVVACTLHAPADRA